MTIEPVSELKNYNNILEEVKDGSPVYLTKNGKGLYAILTIDDVDRYKDNEQFSNDIKPDVSDMDFFIKDIKSLEKELEESEIEANDDPFYYDFEEAFEKLKDNIDARRI